MLHQHKTKFWAYFQTKMKKNNEYEKKGIALLGAIFRGFMRDEGIWAIVSENLL